MQVVESQASSRCRHGHYWQRVKISTLRNYVCLTFFFKKKGGKTLNHTFLEGNYLILWKTELCKLLWPSFRPPPDVESRFPRRARKITSCVQSLWWIVFCPRERRRRAPLSTTSRGCAIRMPNSVSRGKRIWGCPLNVAYSVHPVAATLSQLSCWRLVAAEGGECLRTHW